MIGRFMTVGWAAICASGSELRRKLGKGAIGGRGFVDHPIPEFVNDFSDFLI